MAPKGMIRVRNWRRWQSYRKDRGQPPWIKLHRRLMRNKDWISLTDAQRGQLAMMWLLAADNDGFIPDSASLVRKLCFMETEPDFKVFADKGFLHLGATAASGRRQSDSPKAKAETEAEAEAEKSCPVTPKRGRPGPAAASPVLVEFPTKGKTRTWAFREIHRTQLLQAFPDLDVLGEIQRAATWCQCNPTKQKTESGMPRFLFAWLERTQNSGNGKAGRGHEPAGYAGIREWWQREKGTEDGEIR